MLGTQDLWVGSYESSPCEVRQGPGYILFLTSDDSSKDLALPRWAGGCKGGSDFFYLFVVFFCFPLYVVLWYAVVCLHMAKSSLWILRTNPCVHLCTNKSKILHYDRNTVSDEHACYLHDITYISHGQKQKSFKTDYHGFSGTTVIMVSFRFKCIKESDNKLTFKYQFRIVSVTIIPILLFQLW